MSATASTLSTLGVLVSNADEGNALAEATSDVEPQSFNSITITTLSFIQAHIDATRTPNEWLSCAQSSAAEESPSWKGVILVISLPMGSTNADVRWTQQLLENFVNSTCERYDTSLQEWASDPINLEHYFTDAASRAGSFDSSALSLHDIINLVEAKGHPNALCEMGAGGITEGAGLSDNHTVVQLLSSPLERFGVTVDFVYFSSSDRGDTYAFLSVEDDTPEAAAHDSGAQSMTVITTIPATEAVATTDTAMPCTSVPITDANSDRTKIVIVTLSSAANISSPDANALTDGSTSAAGMWPVSGTAVRVAADLDAPVLTPKANYVTAGAAATTILALAFENTAEKPAYATYAAKAMKAALAHATSAADTQATPTTAVSNSASTGTAHQVVAPPPMVNTRMLQMPEDEWQGDSPFTVWVNRKEVGED